MKRLVKGFIKDEKGLETIEWTLMAGIIILGFLVVYDPVSNAIIAVFNAIANRINSYTSG